MRYATALAEAYVYITDTVVAAERQSEPVDE